ncbi:MAG: phospholipid-binding protein MlaC [Alphaproteobacteria bacterium]
MEPVSIVEEFGTRNWLQALRSNPLVTLGRRALLAVVACAALCPLLAPSPAQAADLPSEAAAFVTGAGGQAIDILENKSLSDDQRKASLAEWFFANFDVRSMGLFALGGYAGGTQDRQRDAYVLAFKDYMIRNYFSRMQALGNEFSVSAASPDGEDTALVVSGIGSRGEKPSKVEWRVRKQDGALKVFDVIVEGSSLEWGQRADFGSVLQHNHGDIAQLMDLMRVQKVGRETP